MLRRTTLVQEQLPPQYHRSEDGGYREFLEDFTRRINSFLRQVDEIRQSREAMIKIHNMAAQSAAMAIMFGRSGVSSPSVPMNQISQSVSDERSLQDKIGILRAAINASNERNYGDKRRDALEQLGEYSTSSCSRSVVK